ncbi:MAG: phosphatase PAP2 family protein [Candidatus Ornithospirochaeta sp.]
MGDNIKKNKLLEASAMTVLAVVFTLLVKSVNVMAVSATGSTVGFGSVNIPFASLFPFNGTVYKVSEYLGYVAMVPVAFFAVMGLVELIKRRSLKKVDADLYALLGAYVLMAAVYIFFDKIYVVNLRPIIEEGALFAEPSFPSSHTLLSVVVLGSAIVEAGRIGNKTKRMLLSLVLGIILVLSVAMRLFSGVHWLTDIIGGILWGEVILLFFQYFLVKLK